MTPEKINPLRLAHSMSESRWFEGCVGQLAGLVACIMQAYFRLWPEASALRPVFHLVAFLKVQTILF